MSDSPERQSPSADEPAPAPARPMLRIVRGDPSPEELGALVAVLAARSAAAPPAPTARAVRGWGPRAGGVRSPLAAGPGAWARSAMATTRTRADW